MNTVWMGYNERRTKNPFKSTRAQKVEYLRRHPAVWAPNGVISEEGVSAIAKQMQAEGMFGARTLYINVRWSIRELAQHILRGGR